MVHNRPKWYLFMLVPKSSVGTHPIFMVPTPGTNPIFMVPTTRVAPSLLVLLLLLLLVLLLLVPYLKLEGAHPILDVP